MNRQPFHVMSQEWRYFSREKALIHTIHLSQLVESVSGDVVTISVTPPTGTSNLKGFNIPKISIPTINPYGGVSWNKATNNYPPLWGMYQDFALITGAYGFSGTFGNFVPIQTVGNYLWPATGGTFLVLGTALSTQNTAGEMDGTRTKLFNSAIDGVVSNVVQDAQWVIRMQGIGWSGNQFVREGNAVSHTSIIMQALPVNISVGAYAEQSSIDGKGNAINSLTAMSLRLSAT